ICPASEPERPGAFVEQVALGLLYLDGPPVLLVHLHRAPTSTAAFTEPLAEAPRTGLHATYLPLDGATAAVLTPEFRMMLSDARQEFKYVLVDCPPVRPGPAALLLAPEVAAGIVTIRAGHTRQTEVQSVCNDLRRCGARLM